jgi:ubiquinone/menaquinone biosynthesis C-methylase UbiE
MPDEIYSAGYVSGLFDRMSRSYERMNFVMSFGFSARWRRQLMALIERPGDAKRVLDAMTGMGETWSAIRQTFPGAELHALDFSPRMIEHAARRNDSRFDGAFALLCEDILSGGLPTARFDVVVCAYALKTFNPDQLKQLADEIARILVPGGRFGFIEVTQPPNRLLRALYTFYLSVVVPVVGTLLVSDPEEYRMLWRYLRPFGAGQAAAAAFTHPLLETRRRDHFYGCATSFSGTRLPG